MSVLCALLVALDRRASGRVEGGVCFGKRAHRVVSAVRLPMDVGMVFPAAMPDIELRRLQHRRDGRRVNRSMWIVAQGRVRR